MELDDSAGNAVSASEGDRRDGESENGTVDAQTDEAEWRDGGIESERPDDAIEK